MICYRRDSGIYTDFELFSAENHGSIDYGDTIRRMIDILYSDSDERLYGSGDNRISFMDYEYIAICSLPLIRVEDGFKYIKLDFEDVNNENIDKIKGERIDIAYPLDNILFRAIKVSDKYQLPDPGYRIVLGDHNFPASITVIYDNRCPSSVPILLRLAGDLAETTIQLLSSLSGTKYFHPSPDYATYSDYEGNYRSTGLLVVKDFPSMQDLIFMCDYVMEILNAMWYADDQYVSSGDHLSDDDFIDSYFGRDFGDNTKWCFTHDELKEIFLAYHNSYSSERIKLIIKKIQEIYFNH